MTSEERHEARYQRRVKKRQERRLALSKSCGDFEDVFSYENLYQSGHICCRGVSWKSSTQTYRFNLVTNTAATRRALLDGTYKSRGFIEFDLYDRGKMRHIRSIHISERVVQRTLCDKVINPTLKPSFIYDNGASTENKGIDFALNRLSCHLQRHYRKYGREGYVGEVGTRLTLDLTAAVLLTSWYNDFGTTYLYKFADEAGNVFIWYASRPIELQERMTLKATIKAHNERNGVKQTVLTRCKVVA